MKKLFLLLILLLCISGVALAAIADATHVAANTTNTNAYGGTVPWYSSDNDPTMWKLRTDITGDWGNDPFTAGDASEGYGDHYLLETTLTLEAGATYDIYVDHTVNISDPVNNDWLIRAGLSSDELLAFDRDGLVYNGTQYTAGYQLAISPISGNRGLFRDYLGQAVADTSGNVTVYIDDAADGVNTTFRRTWYAGVAYEQVVSDPLVTINFNDYTIFSYGGTQDGGETAVIEDGGAALHLTGNVWKCIQLPYTITPSTVLEFDFQSSFEGEEHSLGMDVDQSFQSDNRIKLYGTQDTGTTLLDFNDYDSYAPGIHHYVIPIGQYYTGSMLYLFFVNDHDVTSPTAESVFSNVIISDTSDSPPGAAYNPQPADTATEVQAYSELSLSWMAGYESDSHDVYFGNDYNGVLNADTGSTEYYKGNQTEITFTPPSLELNTTYFWRIDEVNQYGTTPGAVWSFTTDDDCGYWGYSQMDFNSDCMVNLIDFAYLSSVWLGLDMASDLNYDGSADNLDIRMFESDWLTCSLVNKPGSRNYEPSVPIVKLADVTYKNTVDINSNPVALKMYSRWQPQTITEPLPAIVLFFGGGWSGKNIGQFEEYCKYFAVRGIICMAPDYRVSSVEGTSPYEAVTDAKSAVRWVRANAASLNIDPDRIIVGGGSAGGHIAACTELINGYDEPGEDLSVSSRANLLYLLNPVIDTTPAGYGSGRFTPDTWEDLSPVHHVKPGVCPTIVFHGTADTTVPFENVERFTQTMHDKGNICKLVPFPGKKHSFFNHISFKPQMDPADFDACVEVGFKFFIINDFIDGL